MNAKSLGVIVVAVLLAVLAIWLAAAKPWHSQAATTTGAMQISGTTLTGTQFNLASYKGRPVVVNFFAEWCPPCNMEAPDLAKFAKAHPEVAFVGVDENDDLTKAQAFVQKYGLPYPIVYDPQGALGQRYNVQGIPTTFFLDANGVPRKTIVGATNLAGFEAGLASIE